MLEENVNKIIIIKETGKLIAQNLLLFLLVLNYTYIYIYKYINVSYKFWFTPSPKNGYLLGAQICLFVCFFQVN